MSIAFLFSGQGSQYKGMGKEFYDNFHMARNIFELANDALGFDLTDIIFNNSDSLNITEITQPAILTVSTAIFNVIKEKLFPDYVAGLSLGEYSAYVASGVIDFCDAVFLTYNRGKLMSEAVPAKTGSMCAIIGLDKDVVERACFEAGNFVRIANYNAPGQIVISGYSDAVLRASDICKQYGAKLVIKLNVSGPFHTSLLDVAAVKLNSLLSSIKIKNMSIPVVTNISGNVVDSESDIIDILTKQIVRPVRWEDSINTLINKGVDTFVEIGPGKVLCGFVRKIDKSVNVFNIENLESFEKTLARLNYDK